MNFTLNQDMIIQYVLIALGAYALGNINPSIILGKIKHIDIRKEGSGNAGMTNTIRVMGMGAGIAVLIVDVMKAFIAVRIGMHYGDLTGGMIAFAGVVIGHCFPALFGFKGGKGVASSLGAAFALNWASALAALILALVLLAITRRMSVGSICAAIAYPVFVWFFQPECLYFSIGAAAFLVIMHAANISRLARGEEKPLTIGHGKSEPEVHAEADAEGGYAEKDADSAGSDEKEHKSSYDAHDEEDAAETDPPLPEAVDYYAGTVVPDLGYNTYKIGVVGSGSFGTAIANMLSYKGHEVTLYGRNKEALEKMRTTRMNEKYLPFVILSDRIRYRSDLAEAVSDMNIVVFAVPAQTFRSVSLQAAPYLDDSTIVVNLAKGIERDTLKRMSEVAEETLPHNRYVALSGPSHAEEIVRNIPAGVVAASSDREAAETVQDVFMSDEFRVYTQDDMIGVETAGAVKNVIAITTGISDGMKLGNNARAALMTRAIHEIKRLGAAMGAKPETFSGLSGIGDLMVTCSTNLSRNRRCGLMIGLGLKPEEAVKRVGSVVEGYYTADAVCELADRLGVDMPICKATQAVLKGQLEPDKAVRMLMSRDKKDELQ